MAREVRLWEWLRDGLRSESNLHLWRVENSAGSGDPDVNGCYLGFNFQLELKGCGRPKLGGKLDFEVRISQKIWHRNHWRAGGNSWFYIRVGMGAEVARYLVPAVHADELMRGVTEEALAALSVLPKDHDQHDLLMRARRREHN